ncbi:MAG: MBL fold metallo-hydrolase [Methanobrevibacter sp.]|uniref:MBL fold metallo-hydrolase n=1 Tax=Methanobrevibacter millerae TaxID=230361 RepID=A0A8T3VKQ0_9EURY|nr:MBL fold metallo-hydrolase [Methanobrevibacter millerae]MBE6505803.1 MBL fold metallo-hydrolase [Methanobrevibacter millerae]MBR0058043.1 MBL fold metallo-hydrolase [Methanobrevibacter sp.]
MNSNNILFIPGYNMDSNSYLIGDMLVDTGTGFNEEYLISQIERHGIKREDVSLVVNTHCHFDHIGGNYLFENAEIAVHELDAISMKNKDDLGTSMNAFENDANSRVDIELKDGDEIGGFKVIHTPGHTSGGICLWDGVNLISGDTVFSHGGVGRFDIGGNFDDLRQSVFKLTELDVINLLPGHGPIVEGNGKEHIKLSYSQF